MCSPTLCELEKIFKNSQSISTQFHCCGLAPPVSIIGLDRICFCQNRFRAVTHETSPPRSELRGGMYSGRLQTIMRTIWISGARNCCIALVSEGGQGPLDLKFYFEVLLNVFFVVPRG